MATVDGVTAARAQEIEDASVVSGEINTVNGHLILTTGDGTDIDAGQVVPTVDNSPLNSHMVDTSTHGVGVVVGATEAQSLSNKTLVTPIIASMVNAQHDHSSAAAGGSVNVDAVLAASENTLTTRVLANGEVGTPRSLASTGTLAPGKYLILGSCRGYVLESGVPTRVSYYLGTSSGTLYNSPIDVQNEQISRQGGASVVGYLENSANAVVTMYVEKMNAGEVVTTSAGGMLIAIRLSNMA